MAIGPEGIDPDHAIAECGSYHPILLDRCSRHLDSSTASSLPRAEAERAYPQVSASLFLQGSAIDFQLSSTIAELQSENAEYLAQKKAEALDAMATLEETVQRKLEQERANEGECPDAEVGQFAEVKLGAM